MSPAFDKVSVKLTNLKLCYNWEKLQSTTSKDIDLSKKMEEFI